MKLSGIRWLFFDLGNTLINEERAVKHRIEQMTRAFAERGVRVSAEAIKRAFEQASVEFAPRLIARAVEKLSREPADCAYVLNRTTYRTDLDEPYHETPEVLSALAPRYEIGLIANQSAGAEERLKRWGLASFVSLCIFSAEAGLAKPDPAIFRLAIQRAQCEPHEAVMIGDRIDNDIHPAKSVGWKTIRILRGFAKMQTPRTPDEEPDFTVSNLNEITALLC